MSIAPPAAPPTEEAVMGALRGVIDPELGDNLVDLGMIRGLEIDSGQSSR